MSTNEFNLNELTDIPSEAITDEIADKYNGTKVKVRTVYPGTKKSSVKYENGMPVKLPIGQFIENPGVWVETEAFGTDAKGQPLFVKEFLPVKVQNGKVGFSEHKKATGRRFLKMLKINKIEEAIGREVVVVKTSFNERNYLNLSIPA